MTDAAGSYVFISYNSQDRPFVQRLREALDAHQIAYWVDSEGILPGASNWERAIRQAMAGAHSVVLIATPNVLESNAVEGEIMLAENRQLTIYPVWADGESYVDCVPIKMAKAQYIDMRQDRFSEGVTRLVEAIQQQRTDLAYKPEEVQPIPTSAREIRNPYKGLKPFRKEDARDFFGRDKLIGQLEAMIRERLGTPKRLIAVIGPSGSGKSSVVMAGLLPRLEAGSIPGSDKWIYLKPFTPGGDPLEELGYALKAAAPPDFQRSIRKTLEAQNGRGLMTLAQDLVTQDGQHVVVFIDQFEELFTLVDEEAIREQFINTIVVAATQPESPVLIVLTLRADFYDRPINYNLLATLIEDSNRSVKPMTLSELNDAIKLPAQQDDVQLAFERDLVVEIVFDLLEFREPADKTTSLAGALPLLQFTLTRLYELRQGNLLTREAYSNMGGVSGAIGSHAEEEFTKLSEIDDQALNRVFYYLVAIDEQGTPTRRRSPRQVITEGNPAAKRLVESLVKNRLLVAGEDEVLEVAHEALLRSWKRLADWIDRNAAYIQLLHKVQADAYEWERRDKPENRLWIYEDMLPVYEAIDHLNIAVDATVKEFIRPQIDRLLEDFETTAEYRQLGIVDRWREIGDDAAPAMVRGLAYAKGDAVVDAIDRALWHTHDATTDALIGGLKDEDPNLREASAQAVARLGVVGAVPALLDNLERSDKAQCLAEIEAIAALHQVVADPERAIKALFGIVPDRDNRRLDERRAAASTLGLLVNRKDKASVQQLIDIIDQERSWQVRYDVIVALGQIRASDAFDKLVEKARDEDGESYHVRRGAVEALGMLRNTRAMTRLVNAATDSREDVRLSAVKALAALKSDDALSMLMFRMRDVEPRVRQATAEALGQFGHVYALRPLVEALETEKSTSVRVAIASALQAYPDRWEVVDVMRKTIQSETPSVRAAAATTMGGMGGNKARGLVISTLLKALPDRDPSVRIAVIRALGQLKARQATETLMKELKHKRRWQIRLEAAVALAEIADQSVADELTPILTGKDSDAALAASVVLASLRDPGAKVKEELRTGLGHPQVEMRAVAAAALGRAQDRDSLGVLLQAVQSQHESVRLAAAQAICAMKDQPTSEALEALRSHAFLGVRQAAEKALAG